MIEEMRKLTLIVPTSKKKELLKDLRDLSVLHITSTLKKTGEKIDDIKADLDIVKGLRKNLMEFDNGSSRELSVDSTDNKLDYIELAETVDNLKSRLNEIKKEEIYYKGELLKYKEFGNFDLDDFNYINDNSVHIRFLKVPKKVLKKEFVNISYIVLNHGNTSFVAVIGDEVLPYGVTECPLPKVSIAKGEMALDELKIEKERITNKLTLFSKSIYFCQKEEKHLSKEAELEGYLEGMEGDDELSFIQGWILEDKINRFKATAQNKSWGYVIEEPKENENPPTVIKYNGYTRFLKPVLDLLGTLPGYWERDISVWFLSFFVLFVALIIGDAGYGCIMLLLGLFMCFKSFRLSNAGGLVLMLGSTTTLWGALSGTWFGSDKILNKFPFLKMFVVKEITNFPELFNISSSQVQNNMIKLCFTLGAIQLIFACFLNVAYKLKNKNLSAFSDLGWGLGLFALYKIALNLVIGEAVDMKGAFAVVAVGFALVILFSAQKKGVGFAKGILGGLGGAFTTFLNTISAFGNIMSYIRLFAVGMAGVAIEESFNGLASPFLGGFLIPFGALILIIGHMLNFIMGILSVMVHGVRLNVMEFSGQLGIEWSGYSYKPFKN